MSYLNMTAPTPNNAPPPAKRQKTPTGYASTTLGYDSGNDSGDALFDDYVPDTPQAPFETQATQIIDRAALAQTTPVSAGTIIQVPASSPFTGRNASPTPVKPSYNPYASPHFAAKPTQGGIAGGNVYKSPPSNVAMSMAPAGTSYKAPNGIRSKPTPQIISLDDDDELDEPVSKGQLTSDSEDEEAASRANIKPSTFTSGALKFQSIMHNSAYNPTARLGVNSHGIQQTRPERAKPVGTMAVGGITEDLMRKGILEIRRVYPSVSMQLARNTLITCQGSWERAMNILCRQHQPASGDSKSQEAIVIDDDEFEALAKPSVHYKNTLAGPTTSLRDRYSSSTQAQPTKSAEAMATPPKPKRKLMKGRRDRDASSPVAIPSPLKPEPIVIDEYDSDSGLASSSEDDPEIEAQCLKFFNTASLKDIIELTATNQEFAEALVANRPFRNLDRVREVENPKLMKGGKKSKRAPIGEKLVDTAIEMLTGYQAVDSLVAKCGEIAKPIRAEMATWGIKIHGHGLADGELEMTSFDEEDRDSGLGTPTSAGSPKGGDDEVKIASRKRFNYLKKPELMAEDCVLKDYQVVGLNWLAMMYRQKVSCILADEMGLGKTCQVIAFISHLVETGHNGPHLVICPGSTLENWLREIKRFAPELAIECYHGSVNERSEMAEAIIGDPSMVNIVVTTYDIAVKPADNQFLRKLRSDVCVYDEGHMLKNPKSLRYGQLVKIPSTLRLLLTGTPLQNNLQELAALLAFIMPVVFKELEADLNFVFKSKATTKDADHAALLSAQRIARAKSMLTPFVLRRKKDQVLKHLPAKTCRVQYATLHEAQKKIYDSHLDQARERAQAKVDNVKMPKNKDDENNPLMQLRKAAIHPLLFRRHFNDEVIEKMVDLLRKKEPAQFNPSLKRIHLVNEMKSFNDYDLHLWCCTYPCIKSFDIPDLAWMDSGKVDALIKLVEEYKKNGDRVLIFSQFSLVLNILEAVFHTEKVRYIRIDGSTKIEERQPLIDIYRDDEEITAFLLTTKAGGTGINLMYANKVIIFDGSFNPQDDKQAENRAHRVGQTREVEVVRLVTRGTIEEQIYALGQSKLMLDGRVAGEKEEDGDAAGEKAVSAMLLSGTGMVKEEESDVEEKQPKPQSQPPTSSLNRKQSTLLGMATQSSQKEKYASSSKKRKSEVEDENDQVAVKRQKES